MSLHPKFNSPGPFRAEQIRDGSSVNLSPFIFSQLHISILIFFSFNRY